MPATAGTRKPRRYNGRCRTRTRRQNETYVQLATITAVLLRCINLTALSQRGTQRIIPESSARRGLYTALQNALEPSQACSRPGSCWLHRHKLALRSGMVDMRSPSPQCSISLPVQRHFMHLSASIKFDWVMHAATQRLYEWDEIGRHGSRCWLWLHERVDVLENV